jgi:hypothetical protein
LKQGCTSYSRSQRGREDGAILLITAQQGEIPETRNCLVTSVLLAVCHFFSFIKDPVLYFFSMTLTPRKEVCFLSASEREGGRITPSYCINNETMHVVECVVSVIFGISSLRESQK